MPREQARRSRESYLAYVKYRGAVAGACLVPAPNRQALKWKLRHVEDLRGKPGIKQVMDCDCHRFGMTEKGA